jgi:hypothetical protein
MTTATKTELLTQIETLLRHRDIARMIQEQELLDQRDAARAEAKEMAKAMPVVISDDAAPAPGSIYLRMGEQDLLKAIASLKDEAVRTGDYTRVQVAESVLNERRLEKQRQMLKSGAESMTAFQR